VSLFPYFGSDGTCWLYVNVCEPLCNMNVICETACSVNFLCKIWTASVNLLYVNFLCKIWIASVNLLVCEFSMENMDSNFT
jgi:hypothetical protein